MAGQPSYQPACRAEAAAQRWLEARPGFEPGYRAMHCSRVDAFRHRAAPIMADHATVSHASPNRRLENQKTCRAMNVIRHGLSPILARVRVAVNPAAASLATISASL